MLSVIAFLFSLFSLLVKVEIIDIGTGYKSDIQYEFPEIIEMNQGSEGLMIVSVKNYNRYSGEDIRLLSSDQNVVKCFNYEVIGMEKNVQLRRYRYSALNRGTTTLVFTDPTSPYNRIALIRVQ